MPAHKKLKPLCLCCNKPTKQVTAKYCSLQCQHTFQQNQFVDKRLNGEVTGGRSNGLTVSAYIRSYLLKQADYKCSECGWGKKNLVTGKCPLEIHHIDGNPVNNHIINLKVLCPNCHSLTSTYKSLNKGNGRKSISTVI